MHTRTRSTRLVPVFLVAVLASATAHAQVTIRALGDDADEPGFTLLLEADDTVVERSCRVVVPAGTVIEDLNGDGVLHIAADGITVVFGQGSQLRGAAPGVEPDGYGGIGIVVDGHRDVTLKGLSISGYQTAVLARHADGLRVLDSELSDNFRQRLRSTPEAADDGSDWLEPHENDEQQWRRRYGAALAIETSTGVTVEGLAVRQGQNGVILDRVTDSRIVANDLSYLSGWGLALWRSSANTIAGNALDYCVRGYSHGVYNRGQDSAGLLMFEQCHDNLIALNSITHGGDGIFAFAGNEALGAADGSDDGRERRGIGHHGNAFIGNTLSFAAAHGLELTFADANLIRGNSFEGNAICGIWGGYSRGLTIAGNLFAANGDAGYGSERGAVNIEHGRDNAIVDNRFVGNRCGVHLWWDADEHLADLPWTAANGADCSGNVVARNQFEGDAIAVQLRACQPTLVRDNSYLAVDTPLDAQPADVDTSAEVPVAPSLSAAHAAFLEAWQAGGSGLAPPRSPPNSGRHTIVLGTWGPWDHEGSLMRLGSRRGGSQRIDVFGRPDGAAVACTGDQLDFAVTPGSITVTPVAGARGLLPYRVEVEGVGAVEGQLVATTWELIVFPWSVDPRDDLAAWRAQANGFDAVHTSVDQLVLPYAGGGPSQLDLGAAVTAAALPADRFGSLARTRLPLTAGRWQVTTLSDDGVRVLVDGLTVLENWTWHGPTTDTASFDVRADGEVLIEVEHFELDGWATLELQLAPAD